MTWENAATSSAESAWEERVISGWAMRWSTEHSERARANKWWHDRTIGQVAAHVALHRPDDVLLVDGENRLNARSLFENATRLAQSFVARDFVPGTVVSFMLPNWHEACVIDLAAALAGVVVQPLNTACRESELSFVLADSGSRMVFAPRRVRDSDCLAMLQNATATVAAPPEIVLVRDHVPGIVSYSDLLGGDGSASLPTVGSDSVRTLIYTSGSTGRPKGVLHTHNSLAATVQQLKGAWNVSPGDTFLVPSPISHIGGSLYAFEFPLRLGIKAVLQDIWDPAKAVALMEEHECTHIAGATPFLQGILAEAKARNTHLPALKLFVCGGASVPPTLIRDAHDWFDQSQVTRVFGSTEVPTITVGSRNRADIDHGAETDGRIGIAEVKLIDPSGNPNAREGEVLAKGPQMFVGYRHPADNDGVFDDDGFFRSGDIAELVDGEYLRISGRAKDVIIRHGENIAPKEVEDLLSQHPDIADIAIVGLPSARTGEIACAVIVPRPGTAPDVASLRAFLDERRLAKFKMPEQVELRDELPRNASGKVLKAQLRAELIETAR